MTNFLTIAAIVLAVIAITFSIIALVKVIDHEKYIDDIYEWAEDLDGLLDKIIATIGINKDRDIENLKTLARKIDFDKDGNAIIPDELKAKLTPEQLKSVEEHLAVAKQIGDALAKIFGRPSESAKPDNQPSEERKPAKSHEKGQNKVYSQEFKDEVRKYAAENPDASPYKVAKHFGISKNSVKRWTAKK